MKHDEPINSRNIPVINLGDAPGEREAWDRPRFMVYLWSVCELVLVTNPWQISSALRVWILRKFGADIGDNVVFRPRTRVKFPWKLVIGDRSWIGEGVWFHNQAPIVLGDDVVISQESFLTTGSHAHRRDMALITRPIQIDSGAWVTSRCIVTGGTHLGTSCLIRPGSLVDRDIDANMIWGSQGAGAYVGPRFPVADAVSTTSGAL